MVGGAEGQGEPGVLGGGVIETWLVWLDRRPTRNPKQKGESKSAYGPNQTHIMYRYLLNLEYWAGQGKVGHVRGCWMLGAGC